MAKQPAKRVREQVVVYLDERDRALLEKLTNRTGLAKTELFRRGLRRLADEMLGRKAPGFSLKTEDGRTVSLASLKGGQVVLYFYPKDDTPGCTKEACGFAASLPNFRRVKAEIVGVSKDSVVSHDKFKAKYELPFALVADEDGAVCAAYGTWIKKENYGRTYMGIERSTFLIDAAGKIRKVWRGVKVEGHVNEVLAAAKAL